MTTDIDTLETQEWLDGLEMLIEFDGSARAAFMIEQILTKAQQMGVVTGGQVNSPYINSISADNDQVPPGDAAAAAKLNALIRWNAVMMVLRAGKRAPELGGHIASYASAAVLYDIGFNYFFHAPTKDHGGDLLYIQGHLSPGIYARAYLEGRLTADQIDNFRQEVDGKGVASYPHPWLMPDFWQFATVSMGLGPLQAIYQARFLKYQHNRDLVKADNRKVWAFCGDGEMDEPESLGAITLAGREHLDNLIFVVNCNLQRLDGPVRGNGKIIQELEGIFKGAGWNVIKIIWDSRWDELLAKDTSGLLQKRMAECVDGDYQNFKAQGGAYMREHFFGKYPELLQLVAHLSDEEIGQLSYGGLDRTKVYTAYAQAVAHKGQPTIILPKSIKGFGMGAAGEAQNITHQQKKMDQDSLKAFRDRFAIPATDKDVEQLNFLKPADNSDEIQFLKNQRKALGGTLPARKPECESLPVPALELFEPLLKDSGDREISTTMAFVRALNLLMRDKVLKDRIVPIIPDECRTFGMEGMFRQYGIYSPHGQQYTPQDANQISFYKEAINGQVLEEGITESGAFCSWLAAATSYANSGYPMIPFYIYYSMFGFQRFGDLAWAAGDMQARGFLLGGTAGRTTLAGEGLQHQDGHSHVLASTIPNCVTYDPTFAYELAVVMQDGLRRMVTERENVFYYLTVMNENYLQPAMPEGVEAAIIKGLYQFKAAEKGKHTVQLLGSGTILLEVIKAAEMLQADYDIAATIWSATSFNELAKDIRSTERHNRLHADQQPKQSFVAEMFADLSGPFIAATDYIKAYAEQIRVDVPGHYVTLGTDGYGRSDTRAQLRHFFEVDAKAIAFATVKALADTGAVDTKTVLDAQQRYGIDRSKPDPVTV